MKLDVSKLLQSNSGKRKRYISKYYGKNKKRRYDLAQLGIRPQRYISNPINHRVVSQLKYNQVQGEITLVHNAWSVFHLNDGIGTGTSQKNTRIGDKVVIEKTSLRINVQSETPAGTETWPTTESNNCMGVRFVIVEDRQANGAIPTSSEVFENVLTTMQRFNNLGNRDRFKIHEDRFVMYNQGQKCGGLEEFYLRPNTVTNYDPLSTGGAIADIKTGALYLFASTFKYWGFTGDASGMTINIACRNRYTDL